MTEDKLNDCVSELIIDSPYNDILNISQKGDCLEYQNKQFDSKTELKSNGSLNGLFCGLCWFKSNTKSDASSDIPLNKPSDDSYTKISTKLSKNQNSSPLSILVNGPKLSKLEITVSELNNLDLRKCPNLSELVININPSESNTKKFGRKISQDGAINYNSECYTRFGCVCLYDYKYQNDNLEILYSGDSKGCRCYDLHKKCICTWVGYDINNIGCICPDPKNCRCANECICTYNERMDRYLSMVCKCRREEGCICPNPKKCKCLNKCVCLDTDRCKCSLWCLCPNAYNKQIDDNLKRPLGYITYTDTDGIIDISECSNLKKIVFNVKKPQPKSDSSTYNLVHDYKIKTKPLIFEMENNQPKVINHIMQKPKSAYTNLEHLELSSDFDFDIDFDSFGSNYSHLKYRAAGNIYSAEYLNFRNHIYNGEFSKLEYVEFSNPYIKYIDLPNNISTLRLIDCPKLGLDLVDIWAKKLYTDYKLINEDLKSRPMLNLDNFPNLSKLEVSYCPNIREIYFANNDKTKSLKLFKGQYFDTIRFSGTNIISNDNFRSLFDIFADPKSEAISTKQINNLYLSDLEFNLVKAYLKNTTINNLILDNMSDQNDLDLSELKVNNLKISNSGGIKSICLDAKNIIKSLDISSCQSLENITNTSSIESLKLSGLDKFLLELSFNDYPNLKSLFVDKIKCLDTSKITESKELTKLIKLENLHLANLNNLNNIKLTSPSINNFSFDFAPNLKILNLININKSTTPTIATIDLSNLNASTLKRLCINKSDNTFIFPTNFNSYNSLTELFIDCPTIKFNSDFKFAPCLEKLYIKAYTDSNSSDIDLTTLDKSKIKYLNIDLIPFVKSDGESVCGKIKFNAEDNQTDPYDLGLSSIIELTLNNIQSIKSINCGVAPLEKLSISKCSNLTEIISLYNFNDFDIMTTKEQIDQMTHNSKYKDIVPIIKSIRLRELPKLKFKVAPYTVNLFELDIDNIDYLLGKTFDFNVPSEFEGLLQSIVFTPNITFNRLEKLIIHNTNSNPELKSLIIYYKKLNEVDIKCCDKIVDFILNFSTDDNISVYKIPVITKFSSNKQVYGNYLIKAI
jgi:hypothetical protein